MQKVGKIKQLKGKCPNCENKFITTPKDFIMTQSACGVLTPMIKCPYCTTYLYKSKVVLGRTIWTKFSWAFKIVKENEEKIKLKEKEE